MLEDTDAVRLDLYNQGLNDEEIGAKIDRSPTGIRRWRLSKPLPPQHSDDIVDEDKFYELYYKGYSDNEIARELNINQGYVSIFREGEGLVPALVTETGRQRLEDKLKRGDE